MRVDKYHVVQVNMLGKIGGNKGDDRRQTSWFGNIREWTEIENVEQLLGVAKNNEQFAIVTANVSGALHCIIIRRRRSPILPHSLHISKGKPP